ncbi:MAG: hypothetical protein P4L71_03220 [Acetobacteraceae bacterium]|nr:hypothetical protein [Acetobacteraceae bacterium]
MRRLILLVCLLAASPLAASEGEWFVITKYPAECSNRVSTPSEFIDEAQTLGYHYNTNDIKDTSGTIIQTTVSVIEAMQEITFYRGRDRCSSALLAITSQQKRDVDRYK